jgi:hypothetical protein
MITVAAVLFFPVVLAMSLYRLFQLPRDILARKKWFNPNHWMVSMLAASTTYIALGLYTATVLVGMVGVLIHAPKTIAELFSAASILVGYPFVYLAYEWVYHYALDPRPTHR